MIRKLQCDDRNRLVDLIAQIENFNDEEKKVAVELIDEAISNKDQDYYNIYVYENENDIIGYYCIGKRALTDGVYDLYWIVVDPQHQNKGIGKQLLNHAEKFVQEKKGRWILAETSSKESYASTRNFYLRNKYSILAEIKDFYTINDNLIIFGKYIK
ncbi:GNAT family N-acetyltransferase [Rosettibacter firmus]|uniref:GNAT family N-acetyltransferase n=1 Tax=Rosettibacter firmus TaxID=3111522 RepID=UPI00336C29AE